LAGDLVANDSNGKEDVFVRDQDTATTTRVSVTSDGAEANGASANAYISGDGRFVVFDSLATNLVSGDTNALRDVFVHDRSKGTTKRISVGRDGEEANAACLVSGISADGRVIAFTSTATNLVPEANEGIGAFVYYQW
jgi:Tol biopolymer transport system component